MTKRYVVLETLGLLFVTLAVWQILAAARGLVVTSVRSTDPPLTIVRPAAALAEERPLVLVAHGFAGSTVIMRGFALTLAHAGYDVVLWDAAGHGMNAQPSYAGGSGSATAAAVLREALALGVGDARRVAILGHSMGTGAALAFGQDHPATAATIAVSPVGTRVTPQSPRNLLLMAGSLEGTFVRNAQERLAEAGGAGGDAGAGTARQLVVVPGVEHISILFSPAAHATARAWLDSTFGPQPGAVAYTDRRVLWYGLGVVGAVLWSAALSGLIASLLREDPPEPAATLPLWRRLAALTGGMLGASLLLWAASRLLGFGLRSLLGLAMGGYMIVWFAVAGLLSLALLGRRPARPGPVALIGGLLGFAALWLGVGLLGQPVWLPWLLIPLRLALWPLGVLLLLPWFLAAGRALFGAGRVGRLGWWLALSVLLLGGCFLAVRLSPELGFLLLIAPLFPIILGLHMLIAGPYKGSWAYALSGALFTSWLLLAVFPLS
jgi:pimeloyl-ACP methyl ester carboxylesterase